MRDWIKKAGITEGFLFRQLSADGITENIKASCEEAGVRNVKQIGGHSLRVGSAISLAGKGTTIVDMQIAGRWKDSNMPAYYSRDQQVAKSPIAHFKDGKRG